MTSKSDHEEDMSMEEILASIRRFVTDNPSEGPEKKRVYKGDITESVVIPPTAPVHQKQVEEDIQRPIERSSHAPIHHLSEPDILDLNRPISSPQSTADRWKGTSSSQKSALQEGHEDDVLTLTNPLGSSRSEKPNPQATKIISSEQDDGIISTQTMAASANSLSRLVQTSKSVPSKKVSNLADQRNLTLDQLIQDMIRPLIKQWIDTHLPSLVEEMVAKEIKRITKHLG